MLVICVVQKEIREISKMLSTVKLAGGSEDETGGPGCSANQGWNNRKDDEKFRAAVISRKDDGKMWSTAILFLPMCVSRNAAGKFSQISRRWQDCSGISVSGELAGDCRK